MPYEPLVNVGAEFSTTTSIRSEAVLSYDPETKLTAIYLISGEIDYYNLIAAGQEDGSLRGGERLVIRGDGSEALQPFDQTELDSFLAAHNYKELDSPDPDRLEEPLTGSSPIGDGDGKAPQEILGILVGLLCCFGGLMILGIGIVLLVILSRKKRPAPDDGGSGT